MQWLKQDVCQLRESGIFTGFLARQGAPWPAVELVRSAKVGNLREP
jgi:hypothetical protein